MVEVDIEFARKNGRIFCNTCCKAFDIALEEEKEDKTKSDYYGGFNYW